MVRGGFQFCMVRGGFQYVWSEGTVCTLMSGLRRGHLASSHAVSRPVRHRSPGKGPSSQTLFRACLGHDASGPLGEVHSRLRSRKWSLAQSGPRLKVRSQLGTVSGF